MSAFLMNKKNLSSLAYEIFKRGKYNTSLQQAFEAEDINGPEDLFVALRKANLKSLNARYCNKPWSNDDIGEYDLDHAELDLPDIVKGIACWAYQSCESKKVAKSALYKALNIFKADCALEYTMNSDEYKNSKMWN